MQRDRAKRLVNKPGKKVPNSACNGDENVADTQKDEDYFEGKNNAREKKKICKKKD
jgi:hypothetical protein